VRLPVRKAGPEGEHRADYHAEVGFVFEADGEAVVVGVGDQLDQFDRPAFCLGKLQNPRVGGLSALNGWTRLLWRFAAGLLLHGLSPFPYLCIGGIKALHLWSLEQANFDYSL
jgi:hypothetical protein